MRFPIIRFLQGPVTGSVWSSDGSATASFVSEADSDATLTSTGSGAFNAVGASGSIEDGILSSVGTSTFSGIGESVFDSVLSSDGAGDLIGVGESLIDSVLNSSGVGDFNAVSLLIADATLSSSGIGDFSGVGASTLPGNAVLSSDGLGAFNAVGESVSDSSLSSDGIASVSFVGGLLSDGVLSSIGSATAAFIGVGLSGSALDSTGTSVASFAGLSEADSVVVANGTATTNFIGSAAGVFESTININGVGAFDARSPDTFSDSVWSVDAVSRAFFVSGFICTPAVPEPFSCINKSFRRIHQRSLRTIYNRLGANVEYHSAANGVAQYCGIFSAEPEFAPDGYATTVQEDEVLYFFRREELVNPQIGDYIIDEGQRYDVLRKERKGRFEWLLVVREILT